MRRALLKWFIYIAIIILAIGVAVFVYWNLQPKVVLTFNGPITVKPVVVKSEGAVTLHFNYCKLVDVKGTVQRSFVSNKTEFLSPFNNDQGGVGCHKDKQIVILIPPQISPDRYQVRYVVTYQINPISTVVQTYESEPFDVVSADTVLPDPLPEVIPNDPNFYNATTPILTPSLNGQPSINNSDQSMDARPDTIQGQSQTSAQAQAKDQKPKASAKPKAVVPDQKKSIFESVGEVIHQVFLAFKL